jgi:hypothetical protein
MFGMVLLRAKMREKSREPFFEYTLRAPITFLTVHFYNTASNEVLLHLGHFPADSSGTGRVKCFTYSHSLHLHRID